MKTSKIVAERVTAEKLQAAWSRYVWFLGEPPHGTLPQLRVLLGLLPKSEVHVPSQHETDGEPTKEGTT